ncbi:Cdc6/Cdc18 family protein [Methanococcoides methylutens]|nr:AAA family ATPase [Methanococcoides methylutens]
MNDIFGINGIRIFRNRSVLSPQYLPEQLVGREEQVKDVVSLIRPVLHHGEPINALISGNKGTGKTTVVRFVLKQLTGTIEKEGINVVPVFINCRKISTTSKIILEILNRVSPETEIPKTGLSMGKYYRALWKALNEKRTTIIVVFDEIEALKNHSILYDLSHAGENMSIEDDIFVGIIGITDDMFFSGRIDQNIVSSLQHRNIVYPPYSRVQIEQILNSRSSIAFEEDILDKEVVPLCAELSGEEHDPGKALRFLERAGDIADTSNAEKVTENHVILANEEMGENYLVSSLENLPIHSKLVLLSIIKLTRELNDKITTGQIEMLYRNFCDQIGTNPLGRTSVSGIVSEFDMKGIISAPVRSMGRYGKTRLISMRKNPHKIENMLYSDYRLKEL